MIVAGRVRGEPVIKIAEKIGTTRTYVYNVLEKFPNEKEYIEGGHRFSEEDEIFIASCYLSSAPPIKKKKTPEWKHKSDAIITEIAKQMNSSEDEVLNVLSKMRSLHARVRHTPLYPKVEAWRKKNAVSLKSLAKDCHVNPATLTGMLVGQSPMPLEIAERISRRSGLPISEIYGELLSDYESRSNSSDAAAV